MHINNVLTYQIRFLFKAHYHLYLDDLTCLYLKLLLDFLPYSIDLIINLNLFPKIIYDYDSIIKLIFY